MSNVIEARGVSKIYHQGGISTFAVSNVDLTIQKGEFTVLAGPSGSGKTTLLNLVSGLDTPSSGEVFLDGRSISDMSGAELSEFRRDSIGFIFQAYNLIPVLSVEENVEYVMMLQGVKPKERRDRVKQILKKVGLEGKAGRKPTELSGGQQQRVAVARAMVSRPKLILADEPTANLDSATGKDLIDLMRDLNEKEGMTFVFSTHDSLIMERSRRLIELKDGRIENDKRKS